MKKLYFLWMISAVLVSCGESLSGALPLTGRSWLLSLPEQGAWQTVLDRREGRWHIEWLGPEGRWHNRDTAAGEELKIELPQTRPVPVIAWPYVPGTILYPGLLKPAGAIFPYDAEGERLLLSWQGGLEAFLYQELSAAWAAASAAEKDAQHDEEGEDAGEEDAETAVPAVKIQRQPQFFNWPRFRALFEEQELPGEVLQDPWLAGWKEIAVKMVRSGFDKRSIKALPRKELAVPVDAGPWFSSSPFAAPLVFGKGDTPLFPLGEEIGVWFSGEGILKVQKEQWIFQPWE